MGWLEGVWDGNSMLKFQHTYADFPAGKSPNADISAHMLERQHNEYYKLKNCRQEQQNIAKYSLVQKSTTRCSLVQPSIAW